MENFISRTVIVADGSFPVHEKPIMYLRNAARIICCDGSTAGLMNAGFIPDAIVGDMDSLSMELKIRFADRIFAYEEQETNDLTKTVQWCAGNGYNDLVIVGATGKREDHTIGNISLLAEYISICNVVMVTDTGYFIALRESSSLPSFAGQQVSVFSIDPENRITSSGLKYPLNNSMITNWWQATLNESCGDSFRLTFSGGRVIVYLKFMD